MSNSVEKLVSATKAGLNSIIQAAASFDWAWKAALGGALIILPLRFFGLGKEGVIVWVLLVGGAALAGYLRSLPKRLDSARTARWLDERFQSEELLSAALVCMDREGSGRFDGEILEFAETFAAGAPKPRIPLNSFIIKASWVSALCVACLIVLVLAGPARARRGGGLAALEEANSIGKLLENAAALPDSFQGKEAKDLAYRLFPRDKRMASLVERALKDKRIDDLRKLLERAERDFDKRMEKAKSDLERQSIGEELASFQRNAQRGLGGGDENAAEGQGEAEPGSDANDGKGQPEANPGGDAQDQSMSPDPQPGDGSETEGLPGEGSEPGSSGRAGKQNPESGQGQGQGRGGRSAGSEKTPLDEKEMPGPGETGSGKSGSSKVAGEGSGAGVMKSDGRSASNKNEKTLEIGGDDKNQAREMVLPELPGEGKLSAPDFDAKRSSESVLSRKDLPLEYREFAKSYFIRLTEGDEK
jgi:hypothetical protein